MQDKSSLIKERVLQIAEYKEVTKREFFESIEMSYGNFTGKSKKTPLNSNAIQNISSMYPDISLEWLIHGEGEMIVKAQGHILEEGTKNLQNTKGWIPLVPVGAVAGSGKGEIQIKEEDILERYLIPEFERKGVTHIIRVDGSSMYPKYSSGDLLGCKPITDLSFFQWGKVYVLDTDQGVMVKRLFQVEGNDKQLECRSDNPNYPPFKINKSSIYKIAIVIGVVRME